MKIREMKKEDVKSILNIISKTMTPLDVEHAKHIFSFHFRLKKLKISWTEYIVALDGKKVIGVCGLYEQKVPDDIYGIGWFAVDPKYQHKGIGSKLLDGVESRIRSHHGRKIIVYASGLPEFKAPLVFYKKHGYKKEARIKDFFQKKEDAIILTKDL